MSNIKTRISTETQSRLVMPNYAAISGVLACSWTDGPARKHVVVAFTGDVRGTPVWSPPIC